MPEPERTKTAKEGKPGFRLILIAILSACVGGLIVTMVNLTRENFELSNQLAAAQQQNGALLEREKMRVCIKSVLGFEICGVDSPKVGPPGRPTTPDFSRDKSKATEL